MFTSASRFIIAALIILALPCTALASRNGSATCSLSASPTGYITDSFTGLAKVTGPTQWYVAVLNGPTGKQQLDYFKTATGEWTFAFLSEGPGSYVGTLLRTVDNNKGPATFVTESTTCSL